MKKGVVLRYDGTLGVIQTDDEPGFTFFGRNAIADPTGGLSPGDRVEFTQVESPSGRLIAEQVYPTGQSDPTLT